MDARDPQLIDEAIDRLRNGASPGAPASSGLGDVAATGKRKSRRRRSPTRNLVEWAVVLVGALLVALVVKTWLFQAFYIPSGSMEPTLEIGDRVLVNKISYDIGDVDRGHIVVFERPPDWTTGDIDDLIKRVVGLPGDTIGASEGQVYVNGAPLDEPYLTGDDIGTTSFLESSGCVPQCVLGEDELFVLGDNRDNSSASNVYGPIDFDYVVGRAFVRVWPLSKFGGL